jgi:heptosyltransferase-1
VLPWGSGAERERSERLARSVPAAVLPQRLPLAEVARVLSHAWCVIGVDTGLTHLAGALGTPTVGIYTATDPHLTGLYGCARAVNVGGPGASPDVEEVLRRVEGLIR